MQNPLQSIVLIFSLFVSTMSLSQNFDWAGQMGGSGSDEGKGIVMVPVRWHCHGAWRVLE